MRVKRERFEATGRTCNDCTPVDEWVELCIFDDGYISGYEAGFRAGSAKPPTTAVRMVLTPGQPKENT